jgi:hypothetical protein
MSESFFVDLPEDHGFASFKGPLSLTGPNIPYLGKGC